MEELSVFYELNRYQMTKTITSLQTKSGSIGIPSGDRSSLFLLLAYSYY